MTMTHPSAKRGVSIVGVILRFQRGCDNLEQAAIGGHPNIVAWRLGAALSFDNSRKALDLNRLEAVGYLGTVPKRV
jgi:hypothetical protein